VHGYTTNCLWPTQTELLHLIQQISLPKWNRNAHEAAGFSVAQLLSKMPTQMVAPWRLWAFTRFQSSFGAQDWRLEMK